jgi:heme oxygenase (mycobilin-producing)
MTTSITSADRIAAEATATTNGPVTLVNSFRVSPERDEVFQEMWNRTSKYFIARPGFVSIRLHRAVTADAPYRWVNVATWRSEADYRAAHATEEFRRLVTAEGWQEFPSVPVLFEVVTAVG